MLQADPAFREAYLEGILRTMLEGDTEVGQSLLRKYVEATIGFPELEAKLHRSSGSLHAALQESSRPLAEDLFAIMTFLEKLEGGVFDVVRRAA